MSLMLARGRCRVGMIHGAALQGISGWRGLLRDICANLERPKISAKRNHQVGEKCSTSLAVFVRVFGTLWESVLQAIDPS